MVGDDDGLAFSFSLENDEDNSVVVVFVVDVVEIKNRNRSCCIVDASLSFINSIDDSGCDTNSVGCRCWWWCCTRYPSTTVNELNER